jgi:hypothetical protein
MDIRGGHLEGDAFLTIERDGNQREILQVEGLKLRLEYEDGLIDIGGIFNGSRLLKPAGGFVARVIDRYQHELHSLIRPAFERQVAAIAMRVANKSFARMHFLAGFF